MFARTGLWAKRLQRKHLWLVLLCFVFLGAFWIQPGLSRTTAAAQATVAEASAGHTFRAFALFSDPHYATLERVALVAVMFVAFAGLIYAVLLARQVYAADTGTRAMQEISKAVREGADAYLKAQFKKIGPLIVLITVVLYLTGPSEPAFRFGRAAAFLGGSLFSWMVGFVGMRLATAGNLRVAAAAKRSYGEAMQLCYRTGTITGMLTDGLGLLGGTIIFLVFGEQAYEALLGFGFGGTLLALFMRVGGGIYTKAADVGADLVGKIEKDIPEDDPRNAATIADNVGDNVGDCAGMAADIFESYEVTMVAAMILGMATFGHIGVIFPLLVRGIGVVGSIISTYTVRAGANDTSDTALHAVHRGFWIGSAISVVGFVLLGFFYLRITPDYLAAYPQAKGGYAVVDGVAQRAWYNFAVADLDMRPVLTCLIGIVLAIALNKITSYFTHGANAPVKGLARSCQTGHATNIIEGFAVGYESTVAAALAIAAGIFLSVLCYWGASPLFIGYGVAMAGIGMLTLTGNTISMDVFGPVADNANGIGEMGYDRREMGEASYARARQILADLDSVGNTTKAETKGIAIGSAVIAAVSLFASFIATIAVGSEANIPTMTAEKYTFFSGQLTVAQPLVLIGFVIGGTIPFLFSSMLIRAVGRAAFQIVKECRRQFRDAAIWAGTKKPDYGRVVDICTTTAQRELIGPGILAVFAPLTVGLLLGPYALGGFLAGMILTGQLLAVFMANAGGAWDNAKKLIEDGVYGGKGSDAHKASVTGDTVGDPLKDTAGPAINPLVKVMNMVSLLGLGLVLSNNAIGINPNAAGEGPVQWAQNLPTNWRLGLLAAVASLSLISWAVMTSRRATIEVHLPHLPTRPATPLLAQPVPVPVEEQCGNAA